MTDDRGTGDLTFLIEQHKKEIWEYKMKESELIKTQNQLRGSKSIIDELSSQLTDLKRDNKYLAQQVNDYREQLRKAGL
jgi:hypothetical protein|tara:strand:+ start:1107 stop:1343 length:237 start_codon:yes stop_codon:yes gene_type:complete